MSEQVLPIPPIRHAEIDMLTFAARHRVMHGLLEVDVTEARRLVRERGLSFTAFTVACFARAVGEHPVVQGYAAGRSRMLVFADVDVNVQVEREVDGRLVDVPHVVRAAQAKSTAQITAEIRTAKARAEEAPGQLAFMRAYRHAPRLVRRAFWWVMRRSPRRWKAAGGTVGLTAVGMFGAGGGWGIPADPPVPVLATVGGVAARPWVVDGELRVRDILHLTLSFDHDVVDGAPAARFAACLVELLSRAEPLLTGPSAAEERTLASGG